MTKRIILFGPLPPPQGGVAIYLKELVGHLSGSGVCVWTYTGARSSHPNVRFVSHRRLGTLGALIAEGRRSRILDASHFHLEYPNPLLLPVWLFMKRCLQFEWYKNILDGSLPKRYPQFGPMQRWLFHRGVDAVDEFVVASDELRRWLQEDLKISQRVTVVPCLLPPTSGTVTNLPTETARALERYLSHDHRVCSIGVFFPSYGFKHVAEAVEELRRRSGKDIRLLLLDGGFVRDDAYRHEVLQNRDWITVIEEVPNSEVPQILKQSDVFVRAFGDESYGISRIEALWAGIPVIATRAGETRGMLTYDFGDLDQLISHLQSVLFDASSHKESQWPELYRKEAENNLAQLAEVLGIEIHAR
ncbi:MAG TPA: glycosyltransferase family 4 protein [Pyrinomonadaceae bacterium]|nr:glycosyltransferase family 4 protein [Pyrinomonadaceae bacterium]